MIPNNDNDNNNDDNNNNHNDDDNNNNNDNNTSCSFSTQFASCSCIARLSSTLFLVALYL